VVRSNRVRLFHTARSCHCVGSKWAVGVATSAVSLISTHYCLLVNFSASNWLSLPLRNGPARKLLVSCLAWCRKLCRAVSNAAIDQLPLYLAQPTILCPTALWGDNTHHKMLPQFACHTSLNWVSGCSMQHVSCAWIKFEWLKWTELNRPPKSREWLTRPAKLNAMRGCSCAAEILLECYRRARRPQTRPGTGSGEEADMRGVKKRSVRAAIAAGK